MGRAAEVTVYAATNPGAGPTAATTASSADVSAVRSFDSPAMCYLDGIGRQGGTLGFAQVRSPSLHDNNTGIRVTPGESPAMFAMPAGASQPLRSGDVPVVELSGGAAEVDLATLFTYYTAIDGFDASLHDWGEIVNNIKYIKPIRVALNTAATAGAWASAAVNSTEDVFHAGKQYAVLGYSTNTAVAAVAVVGSATGNLRVGGPGAVSEFATTDYFRKMNERTGRPYIPVFNANDKAATSVAVAAVATATAVVVELICAELASNLS